MKVKIEKSFDRDVSKVRDKKILQTLYDFIPAIEGAKSIQEIRHIKKIEGYGSFYRIKLGDYRLGIEKISSHEILLSRFLHRKDIYRYFPKK